MAEEVTGDHNTVVETAPEATTMHLVDTTTNSPGVSNSDSDPATTNAKQGKKRLCRFPGCTRVIKSQGHCQRHGARAKRCRVEGCDKQAQGTHDGMCKRHWKLVHMPDAANKSKDGSQDGEDGAEETPEPRGESVYDSILPLSIAYRPGSNTAPKVTNKLGDAGADPNLALAALADPTDPLVPQETAEHPATVGAPSSDVAASTHVMPLVRFLHVGSTKNPAGWHRNAERRARGLHPVTSLSVQLEPWERQLALVEILLLSGGTPYANFKELAYAWGREKGFHHLVANSVCERRGEVERKRRSDAGRTMTPEERDAFKRKLKRARGSGSDQEDHDPKQLDVAPHDTAPADVFHPPQQDDHKLPGKDDMLTDGGDPGRDEFAV